MYTSTKGFFLYNNTGKRCILDQRGTRVGKPGCRLVVLFIANGVWLHTWVPFKVKARGTGPRERTPGSGIK